MSEQELREQIKLLLGLGMLLEGETHGEPELFVDDGYYFITEEFKETLSKSILALLPSPSAEAPQRMVCYRNTGKFKTWSEGEREMKIDTGKNPLLLEILMIPVALVIFSLAMLWSGIDWLKDLFTTRFFPSS